ncbi:ABC transporter permease [Mycoplasma procyoni]|uniref:ABC transporter permease n=1 Tax=Mycoplasma procyoni TaxID=568784 RepID=UPI00197C1D4B|nr:ABC transporter permease [Mycoplasma procyoni]MBN3534873.1 ABC transporter permease [Mycoplasma procyoni]
MKAVVKLINAYYWKGFFGPFFTIVWPLLIFLLLGNVTYSTAIGNFKKANLSDELIQPQIYELAKQIIVGVLVSTIISNGLIGFSTVIVDFKKSTLIKRIGSANINKTIFMIATLIYQFIWTLFVILWVPLVGSLILGFNKYLDFSVGFNFGLVAILPYIFLTFLVSVSLGFLIISLVKSTVAASSLANLIFFPISFLSGGLGTGKPDLTYAPILKYFSYIIPTKYSTDHLFSVFSNNGYSSLSNLVNTTELIVYPIVAIMISVTFLSIAVKKFKWGE